MNATYWTWQRAPWDDRWHARETAGSLGSTRVEIGSTIICTEAAMAPAEAVGKVGRTPANDPTQRLATKVPQPAPAPSPAPAPPIAAACGSGPRLTAAGAAWNFAFNPTAMAGALATIDRRRSAERAKLTADRAAEDARYFEAAR